MLVLCCAEDKGSNYRCPAAWLGCLLVPCRSNGIACLFLGSVLESAGKRFCAALPPHRKPEWSYQLSRCDCEHRPYLLRYVLAQTFVLLSGNKGDGGKLSCSGKALQPAELPEDIRSLLDSWHCNTGGFVHFQVALLDFGATRGFDEKFTDVYIEVRTCTVSYSAALGVLAYLQNYAYLLAVSLFTLNALWVWREAGLEARGR